MALLVLIMWRIGSRLSWYRPFREVSRADESLLATLGSYYVENWNSRYRACHKVSRADENL